MARRLIRSWRRRKRGHHDSHTSHRLTRIPARTRHADGVVSPAGRQRPCSGGRPTRAVTTSAATTTVIDRACARVSATPAVDVARTIADSDEYRRGSNSNGWGWGNSSGSNGDVFRRGFAEGYQAGYHRFRGSTAATVTRLSRAARTARRGPMAIPAAAMDTRRAATGTRRLRRRRRHSVASRTAIATARSDARDNDRYEPTRKKKYREGDDGYNSRYGSRDQYRNDVSSGVPAGIRPRLSRGPVPLSKVSAARCRLT